VFSDSSALQLAAISGAIDASFTATLALAISV
jgi:hypothetical protein